MTVSFTKKKKNQNIYQYKTRSNYKPDLKSFSKNEKRVRGISNFRTDNVSHTFQ